MSINNSFLKLSSNHNVDNKLGDIAAKFAVQNFDYRYATLLLFNSTLFYGVELFLRVFNYNVIVNRGIIKFGFAKIIQQYVIFGNDATDLQHFLDTLWKEEIKNDGKFIIICQSQVSSDCDETEMSKLFWKYKIVDVVFIKYEQKETRGFTYFPFSDGDCHNVRPVHLYSSNYSHLTTNQGKIFGMKLRKFHFCPLYVSTVIQIPYMNIKNGVPTGADGDLLSILAYGLNSSMKIMTPRSGHGWGYRRRNGTWVGSLADVYEELANVSMTSAALTLSRYSDFQISHSYHTMDLVWITHPATLQNEALILLRPFKRSTRIVLVVSYMLVLLCALVIKSLKCSTMFYTTQEHQLSKSIIFYSWMICLGQSITKLPTKSALMYVTLLWISYCSIIRTIYQDNLISSLKGKFYDDQFETIEDAMRANYPFGGGGCIRHYYVDYPQVYNNWVKVDTRQIISTALKISKGKKFVLAINSRTVNKLIKKYKISLHVLPQKIISNPTVLFLKKYSPLSAPIDLILSRLIAAGFPEEIHKKYTNVKFLNKTIVIEQDALTIVDFAPCYILLLSGWLLSGIFFLFEIFFGKIYKHSLC